jgi:hypothetical protein
LQWFNDLTTDEQTAQTAITNNNTEIQNATQAMQQHITDGGSETDDEYLGFKQTKETAEGRVTELQNNLTEVQ